MQNLFIIFVSMSIGYSHLSNEQRQNAVQRLTALWAFTESGLGGVMHALQIPFTGLLVGGMAVIMISLIADISANNYRQVLKSAMIVLIVKAIVSPYTPFPAYIAVSFQALLGYGLFRLLSVNFFSILLLSSIAMLESAIQKLLILTLFFGNSLWKALDSMIALLTQQFGNIVTNGSYWIAGIYICIYLFGGFFIAWLANRTIKSFTIINSAYILDTSSNIAEAVKAETQTEKNNYKKLWVIIMLMTGLSIILFVIAADNKQGWAAVIKTISWTLTAILIWFMLIGPLLTKAVQRVLQKKESRYSEEVLKSLSFLPVLRKLAALSWQQSKSHSGFNRWHFFFSALIHTTLTYSESGHVATTSNSPV